jgi:hypothetical protein
MIAGDPRPELLADLDQDPGGSHATASVPDAPTSPASRTVAWTMPFPNAGWANVREPTSAAVGRSPTVRLTADLVAAARARRFRDVAAGATSRLRQPPFSRPGSISIVGLLPTNWLGGITPASGSGHTLNMPTEALPPPTGAAPVRSLAPLALAERSWKSDPELTPAARFVGYGLARAKIQEPAVGLISRTGSARWLVDGTSRVGKSV